MRGLSKDAINEVEFLATILLTSVIDKHGPNFPTNDPDYCEAFGVLRGAIATLGPRITNKIRISPGHGDHTHDDIHDWCRELINKIVTKHSIK